jgi:DNA-binding HxlR family transcriptional regulator
MKITKESEFEKLWDVFSKRWNLRILKSLDLTTVMRFNELKQSIRGISANLLSERLDELERLGLVKKIVINETSTHVGYLLNEKCERLKKILLDLDNWISLCHTNITNQITELNNSDLSKQLFEILKNEIKETELQFIKDKLLFSNTDSSLDLITNFDKLKNIILELYGDYAGNKILQKLSDHLKSYNTN